MPLMVAGLASSPDEAPPLLLPLLLPLDHIRSELAETPARQQ